MGGFSKSRLERVREVLDGHVRRGEVPGAIALVSRGGQTHVEKSGDVTEDTIFRISSMSKPVVAVAAMILVVECVLRLDDAVDGYLPELASRQVLTRLDAPLDSTVPGLPAGPGVHAACDDRHRVQCASGVAGPAAAGVRNGHPNWSDRGL